MGNPAVAHAMRTGGSIAAGGASWSDSAKLRAPPFPRRNGQGMYCGIDAIDWHRMEEEVEGEGEGEGSGQVRASKLPARCSPTTGQSQQQASFQQSAEVGV